MDEWSNCKYDESFSKGMYNIAKGLYNIAKGFKWENRDHLFPLANMYVTEGQGFPVGFLFDKWMNSFSNLKKERKKEKH